jgi:hypothetical protein
MLTEPEPEAAADTSVCMPVGGGGGAEKPTGSVEKKPKKNRCVECRKKVGLTGFECKCGGLYCGMHRMASSHACTFDHAGRNKELLEKRVQSVIADKVEKVCPTSLPPSLPLSPSAPLNSHARGCADLKRGSRRVAVSCCEGGGGQYWPPLLDSAWPRRTEARSPATER